MTELGSRGVEEISKLPNLEHLSLRYADVHDSCIPDLEKMNLLSYLDVRGTRLSKEAVLEFCKSHPAIDIEHDFEED